MKTVCGAVLASLFALVFFSGCSTTGQNGEDRFRSGEVSTGVSVSTQKKLN